MTLIDPQFVRTNQAGEIVPARGHVLAVPTHKRFKGDTTLIPTPFQVSLDEPFDLEPNGPEWCWKLTFTLYGVNEWTEYVTVPDTDETLEYKELIKVDPATLGPADDNPDPAWWAALRAGIQGARPGPPGERGPRGERGSRGTDGKDGQDGIDAVATPDGISRALELLNIPGMVENIVGSSRETLYNDAPYVPGSDILPVNADMGKWAGWGSSSMFLMHGDFTSLAASKGAVFYSGGKPSEKSYHIAARIGSIPAKITFPNNTVPGTGSVIVTSSNIDGSDLMTYSGYVVDKAGNRIDGTLSDGGGSTHPLTFTRNSPGTSTTINADSTFTPNAGHQYRDAVTVLWMGKNNLWDDPQRVIVDTNASFDFLAPLAKRCIVLGHFNNQGTPAGDSMHAKLKTVHDAHRSRYGRAFIDISAYLTGSQVWVDTNITPTPEDLAQQKIGNKPPSLSKDIGHLNDAANKAILKLISARIDELGWYATGDRTTPDIKTNLYADFDANTLSPGALTTWTPNGVAPFTLTNRNNPSDPSTPPTVTTDENGNKRVTFDGTNRLDGNPQTFAKMPSEITMLITLRPTWWVDPVSGGHVRVITNSGNYRGLQLDSAAPGRFLGVSVFSNPASVNPNLPLGQTTQAAMRFATTSVTTNIYGVETPVTMAATAPVTDQTNIHIGGSAGNPVAGHFKGDIYRIQIWGRILTDTELKFAMAENASRYKI